MNTEDNDNDAENQRLLDELMRQGSFQFDAHPASTSLQNEYDFMQFHPLRSQGYPGDTPAHHHEKLSYMSSSNNRKHSHNQSPNTSARINHDQNSNIGRQPFISHHASIAQPEPQASFLDDMFATSSSSHPLSTSITATSANAYSTANSTHPQRFSSHQENASMNSFSRNAHLDSNSEINNKGTPTNILDDTSTYTATTSDHDNIDPNNILNDFLFRPNDDAMFNYADDISTSVGSSINSELLASSYSSSFSFNPTPYLENMTGTSVTSNNNNLNINTIRSPTASSIRPGSFISTSLRNASININNNTPKTRNTSISSYNNTNNNIMDGFTPNGTSAGFGSLSKSALSHLTAEEKLKRKREFHNAVERRRRELIKQKIKELGNLVPPYLLHYDFSTGKQIKTNKGIILNKSVEYVAFLQNVISEQANKKNLLQNKVNELEIELSKLGLNANELIPQTGEGNHNMNSVNETDSHQSIKSEYLKTNESSSGNNTKDNNITLRTPTGANDDLQEFLSGAAIEAQDNERLMFGDDEGNPADYLLEFDS
ncbi:Rtg3p NDAI_0E04590 [Naumovozyma dairenensis CBS 421]|uniref:BHLH domain-containing protein n=1 Tax=Naumovozyma dairenensis (strain ATCC 10597 / BCRC 20456 / CBS 421 / NBRC 0211 / NRRL Y-12639) TaxID=1071378 RepID=G0WC06_NAUDC|nr:hypothetical protein NDAI_0E04590 [Naumovozyma dairenensis CBS 421]CCD25276.1 hypothetical protein NDAI_0E04590 [Naumovozyma dairenensis CBS 421]